MKKRVTITLDPEVHRAAKRRASREKTSVSGLIESLLGRPAEGSGDTVSKMVGMCEVRPAENELGEALHRKYLRS
jgi:hypothetical protein